MSKISNVIGEVFQLHQFTWIKSDNCLIAKWHDVPECLRELWDDDMALGFGIHSVKTGRTVFFTLDRVDEDEDGNVLSWIFEPHNHGGDSVISNIRVKIYK